MEIDVHAAKTALDSPAPPLLVDVREDDEVAHCHLPKHLHIPLQSLPEKVAHLPVSRDHPIILYCHHGMRSLRAARFLHAHGFANAVSLRGGIEAWSREIDPTVPRY